MKKIRKNPSVDLSELSFLEIRFDEQGGKRLAQVKGRTVDEEYRNKIMTGECSIGTVTISFDEFGELESLEIC